MSIFKSNSFRDNQKVLLFEVQLALLSKGKPLVTNDFKKGIIKHFSITNF